MPVHNIHTEEQLKATLIEHNVVVVDFFATWCETSKSLAPIFVEQANRDDHKNIWFGKIDVDEVSELASKLGITSTPTFQVYKNGDRVAEYVTPGPQALLQFIGEST